jgi:hypothetical protein
MPVLVRVAIMFAAMGCAHGQTQTIEVTMPPQPVVASHGGICDIDPSVCPPIATLARRRLVPSVWAVIDPRPTTWTRLQASMRRIVRNVGSVFNASAR